MKNIFLSVFLPILLLIPLSACASSATSLEKILAADKAPTGVIIEIVTADQDALSWALPLAKTYIKQLRRQYPKLPIAIVTHGREQFALQKARARTQQKVHSLTESLNKEDVPLHVCGTYAGRRGLAAEDFPDYVDVAPAGPAQVNDYLALNYRLIVINSRSKK